MANDFNLNRFLNEYKTYNSRQYTAVENGKAAMEQRTEENIAREIQGNLLGLTLKEKLTKEFGIGDKVIAQIGETAKNALLDIVKPISDYYNKYDIVLDEDKFENEVSALGKTMFFTERALSMYAENGTVGKNFVLDV